MGICFQHGIALMYPDASAHISPCTRTTSQLLVPNIYSLGIGKNQSLVLRLIFSEFFLAMGNIYQGCHKGIYQYGRVLAL